MTTMIGIGVLGGTLFQAVAATPHAGAGRDGDKPPMNDIHDIKPIVDIAEPWPWLLYLVCGAVLLLILATLVWWLRKRRSGEVESHDMEMPDVAPDVEALSALDALAVQTGLAPKQFFYRLSAILRRYVERRYHFPAAEMTTEELLPHMDRLGLDRALTKSFKAFCREADPIKFAGAMANQERSQQHLVFCRDFVYQTREKAKEGEERESSPVH